MSLRSDNYYRSIAEQALRDAGLSEPPVSIEGMAEFYAVPITRLLLPPWFTVALVYEDGLPAVLLNVAKEPETQRDALAHVLGHLVELLNDTSASYPRGSMTEHHAADIISAELLTPSFMVTDQAQKWFNDYRYLARLFGVSEARMLDKMQDMGIIRKRGIVWDY